MSANALPIIPYLDSIVGDTLASPSRSLVLTAETGAGKSTAVPQAFLERVPGKILVLEPRRVAAAAVASRIAELLGCEIGETVGWRMRLDTRTSAATRIEIITEAILTRMLQSDPGLSGVSVVILDEFHERSVHSDLALALLNDVMSLRDDLYLLVMSATIDSERLSSFLSAPAIRVRGRTFPVDIRYRPVPPSRDGRQVRIEAAVAHAILEALNDTGLSGDVLAFLPGIAELRRCAERLTEIDADVFILHSSVPLSEQRTVLSRGRGPGRAEGRRRVILSSSIAETSVTVPGVSIVVDSGLSRTGRLDVPTGMYRLVTGLESEFSAAQRAGRAGRTGPGTCIRLWAPNDPRIANPPPEILVSDLDAVVLECALWGVTEIDGLRWLDPPKRESWEAARELLNAMGALDGEGKITAKGKRILRLALHPRLAAVALAGSVSLAVKYSGTDPASYEGKRLADELTRKIGKEMSLSAGQSSFDTVAAPSPLLAGFPDRLARHAGEGRYRFPSGRIAALPPDELRATNAFPEWIVAPETDPGDREGRIRTWEPLDTDKTLQWLKPRLTMRVSVSFAGGEWKSGGRVEKRETGSYGKIEVYSRRLESDGDDVSKAVCEAIRTAGVDALPWSAEASAYLNRARFANPERFAIESLLATLEEWLAPFVSPNGRLTEDALLEALRFAAPERELDRDAPAKIRLQNGLERKLAYEPLDPGKPPEPILEIRVQELFGCPESPRIRGIPVLLRLLSPARRPLQVTRDLAGFWKNTWPEVRKEMRGRYPKHKWPEDPFSLT